MKVTQKTEKEIGITDYYKPFLNKSKETDLKLESALERAWKNRDFEIDKYWSRATYFWTFIAATLTGYILVGNANKDYNLQLQEAQFAIASLGLVFSFAWCLVNIGSKKWQENWEKHIDMLEDYVTGPIYKTVLNEKGYSVSKINLLVSQFVFFVWAVLWVKSLFPEPAKNATLVFSWWKFIIAIVSISFLITMLTKHDKYPKMTIRFSFRRRDNQHKGEMEALMEEANNAKDES